MDVKPDGTTDENKPKQNKTNSDCNSKTQTRGIRSELNKNKQTNPNYKYV